MRGTEKHTTQASSSRYSTRSNRANTRTTRKEVPSALNPTTRSHPQQTQLPPLPIESNPGPFEYLPSLLPPTTTTGMIPSEHSNIEPSLQPLPVTQRYPSAMPSAPNDNGTSTLLPSPGATTPTTGTSIPSPPPNPNTNNSTNIPEYPQSAYNYGTWTSEEDKSLLNARGQGHHWAQIQRTHFPSKTANACRKRYERLMERRGIYDLDREKLEKVAHEYMGMRKEIWSGLAARVGERWNVVEAQCMSSGLRTIQLNARSHARRQRHESRVSQRTSAPAQQHYPYLSTTDNGMMDMINHHHHHPHHHGGSSVGNTLLAPVGFAPISPLDDEHPATHHASHGYSHSEQGNGGWANGQHHQEAQHHPQRYDDGGSSSSNTPTADMVTPTTSTRSAEQGHGYREYPQVQEPHLQPQQHQHPLYGPGPPSSSYAEPNIPYNTGYSMNGPSQRR